LAEPDAGTKNPGLDGGNGDSQSLREFAIGPAFGLLQDESVLEGRVEAMECFPGKLFAHVLALGILAAVFNLWKRTRFVFGVARIVIVGDAFGVALAELHERFIDGDAH